MKVVSLETAKLLKEAGYPQKAAYYYCYSCIDPNKDMSLFPMVVKPNALEWYVAPITDEILENLPDRIRKDNLNYGFRLWFVDYMPHVRHYCCNYFVLDYGKKGKLIMDDFIVEQFSAEAVAKVWLYLRKNKLI